MKTYNQFLLEEYGKKYVAVFYDEETQNNLREWVLSQGLDLTVNYNGDPIDPEDFEFHTTIFYTVTEHDADEFNLDLVNQDIGIGVVAISGFEMLGENKDIPVLLVESQHIRDIRDTFENDWGMRDSWPEYKAHVSLSYGNVDPSWKPDSLPSFMLTFDKLRLRNIREEESKV